ncbi:hypothetical protein GC197_10350 [bacterium]|nr:hypothetical protein [bacterium]
MDTALLQRESKHHEPIITESESVFDRLAAGASESLGYNLLAKKYANIELRRSVFETLAEIDVLPFTQSSVDTYKEACVGPRAPWIPALRTFGANLRSIGTPTGILLLTGYILAWVLIQLSLFFAVLFYAVLIIHRSGGPVTMVRRKWVMHALAKYPEPIPDFALQTIDDLRAKHPGVEFFVCALEEEEVVIDPFLVLRLPDGYEHRDYYLEVWNESGFSGRREC